MCSWIDTFLWLWGELGILAVEVFAPGRVEQVQRMRSLLINPPDDAAASGLQAAPQMAEASKAMPAGDKSTTTLCPMTIDTDLVQPDQDPGVTPVNHTSTSPPPVPSHGVISSCVEASTPTVPHLSCAYESRDLQMRMEDLRLENETTETRHLLGLLLRSREDNAVLKAALHTTLAKLQAAREQLQFTRAELQVSQEQATLLLEERESACFSQEGSVMHDHEGTDTQADLNVKRSLDSLLEHCEASFPSGEGSSSPPRHSSPHPCGSSEADIACSLELCTTSVRSPRLNPCSIPVSPSRKSGVADAHRVGKPKVHLQGVGYRMDMMSLASSPGAGMPNDQGAYGPGIGSRAC